jgi:hypothetical protein
MKSVLIDDDGTVSVILFIVLVSILAGTDGVLLYAIGENGVKEQLDEHLLHSHCSTSLCNSF